MIYTWENDLRKHWDLNLKTVNLKFKWPVSPRFEISERSTSVDFNMKFELHSYIKKKKKRLYCQAQRIEPFGGHLTEKPRVFPESSKVVF